MNDHHYPKASAAGMATVKKLHDFFKPLSIDVAKLINKKGIRYAKWIALDSIRFMDTTGIDRDQGIYAQWFIDEYGANYDPAPF